MLEHKEASYDEAPKMLAEGWKIKSCIGATIFFEREIHCCEGVQAQQQSEEEAS
jgi:hypothetical protein